MRLNNSVKFASAPFNGLKIGAMYAFSNQAGNISNNAAYSAGLSYSFGPINLAASCLQINRDPNSPNASGAASTGDGDALTLGGLQTFSASSTGGTDFDRTTRCRARSATSPARSSRSPHFRRRVTSSRSNVQLAGHSSTYPSTGNATSCRNESDNAKRRFARTHRLKCKHARDLGRRLPWPSR
ncbi:porin [Paraburkholderia silviterrae]|uniref:Porin n=1 Tax=Paraburkholderia silviterrae TaxID=2528715 RepID=A0A4R5M161_9BURK|nr:porin [Paraburkholderia silviterrae]TDG18769.1 porin [Paraburkholderia silviterrae]